MAIEKILIPDIGGEAQVTEIYVKVGDVVKVDQSLLMSESDKAAVEVPSIHAGVIKEIRIKPGDTISEGHLIMTIETDGADTRPAEKPGAKSAEPSKPSAPVAPSRPPVVNPADIHAGPAVRRIAMEFDIDLTKVRATGEKGRITIPDLKAFLTGGSSGLPAAPYADPAEFGVTEIKVLSRIKKLSGKHLHACWVNVPHVTQMDEADITAMEAYRLEQKEKGVKLTPLVFVMKAVVAALKEFPSFNATLSQDGENLILKKYFHIGVAVDTPNGLVVPVIRDVDQKSLAELAKELGETSLKAREGKLMPKEMKGGCFTISSLGGIGGTSFTPVVNLPEVAILGVSKSSMKPVYQDGAFVPRLMLPLALSYDHRVIDGAEGARFITFLSRMLADIQNILL